MAELSQEEIRNKASDELSSFLIDVSCIVRHRTYSAERGIFLEDYNINDLVVYRDMGADLDKVKSGRADPYTSEELMRDHIDDVFNYCVEMEGVNAESVKVLLDLGADVDCWYYHQKPVISKFITAEGISEKNKNEIIKLLLERGADLNLTDRRRDGTEYTYPMVKDVCANLSIEMIDLFKEKGLDFGLITEEGTTYALESAVEHNRLDILKHLEEIGVDVFKKDENGKVITSIKLIENACNDVNMVRYLAEHDVDFNTLDVPKSTLYMNRGNVAVSQAVRNGNLDVLKCLDEIGVNLFSVNSYNEYTAYYYLYDWTDSKQEIKNYLDRHPNKPLEDPVSTRPRRFTMSHAGEDNRVHM